MLGRLIHYAADAVLVSAVLAGIRRSSGLTLKTDTVENKELRDLVEKYLDLGEKTLDMGASLLSSSKFFERRS
ncbi:hypothetical protein IWQ62_005029 [Dispira parvispora]|uniref:DUF1748-domain-containing protein n=1 Tax=Dispira parvispora TaxID=1520584 RepID=A0A9W8E5L8_9FUNG|nr:hypothetical protein IWQ62_005029 [Dispira parvispora]